MEGLEKLYAWVITGILAVGGSVVTYLMNRSITNIDDTLKRHSKLHDDHAKFETHVANTYAKEETLQASLARVHDRIDSGFKEIRDDIRSLIKK